MSTDAMNEGLLGAQSAAGSNLSTSSNPNGDPEIEPLSKAPFDPESPECLPYHLPDDLENFIEWPTMVVEEFDQVTRYVKGLGEMEKTGNEDAGAVDIVPFHEFVYWLSQDFSLCEIDGKVHKANHEKGPEK